MTSDSKKTLHIPTRSTSVFGLFKETFRGYRRSLAILIALGFLGAVLDGIGINMIVPFIAFLTGTSGGPTDTITHLTQQLFALAHVPFKFRYLVAFMTGMFLLRSASLVAFTYVRARIGAQFMEVEMSTLLGATLRARWPYLVTQKSGVLQNTIFWDVKRSATLLDVVAQAVQSWSGCFVYLIIALNISPLITTVTIVAGAIFLFLFRPLIQKTRYYAEITSTMEKRFIHHLTENLGGLKFVKASASEEAVGEEGRAQLAILQDAYAKSQLVQSLSTVLIQPFSFIFIIGMFVITYLLGTFNLAAFAATFYLIQKIFTYLQSGQTSLQSISDLTPYAENVTNYKKVLGIEAEIRSKGHKEFSFEDSIVFHDVTFSHSEVPVFSNVSLSIPKGHTVALIGPSGGGKTSIADLVLRLLDPVSGSITIDNNPIDTIDLAKWRNGMGYVAQDAFLIHASIEDNIRFYRAQLTSEDIARAVEQANLTQVIDSLPDGLSTVVGDRGVTLSGGQRQRVALARALAGSPQILILDEATSALDAESERLVQESILKLHGSVTVLVIAHRLSTIKDADYIYVLDKGSIREEGKPSALLENKDSYFREHTKNFLP
jgi:ATP-binding cassette subfamily C protein